MTTKHGIFCIEGEWEKKLTDQSSIQPLVQFLANGEGLLPPIYRRVATKESLNHFVSQWREYKNYSIGYLSFHGKEGSICLGKEDMKLSELGDLLKGACKNKHLILSSCETLAVKSSELAEFRRITGARSVSGYRKCPDWIESSAFDVILMTNLLHHDSPSKTESWLQKRCAGLMDNYGFVMNYRTRNTGA